MRFIRPFLASPCAALLALAVISSLTAADWKPRVAIQSWTLRNLTFEQSIDFAAQIGRAHV